VLFLAGSISYASDVTDFPATRRLIPMSARDPQEPHRAASSLELFFDLVFVVAVSIAAVELHHAVTEGHVSDGIV